MSSHRYGDPLCSGKTISVAVMLSPSFFQPRKPMFQCGDHPYCRNCSLNISKMMIWLHEVWSTSWLICSSVRALMPIHWFFTSIYNLRKCQRMFNFGSQYTFPSSYYIQSANSKKSSIPACLVPAFFASVWNFRLNNWFVLLKNSSSFKDYLKTI